MVIMEYLHSGITNQIICTAYKVHSTLGYGFLEKVYENVLAIELNKNGLKIEQQKPLSVYYEGDLVGEYYIDLLVEDSIIVEVKTVKKLLDVHEIQVLNYLKGCRKEVGLLINFGKSVDVKRKYRSLAEQSE